MIKKIDTLIIITTTGATTHFTVGKDEIEWLQIDNENKFVQYKLNYKEEIITINLNMVVKWIYPTKEYNKVRDGENERKRN